MRIWILISAALGVACVGLLVWSLSLQSDLDASEQQTAELQAQIDQAAQQGGGTIREALSGAYESLTAQLGATQTDVAALQQDIADAKTKVQEAQADARTAAEDAGSRVEARIDEAQANAEVAKGQAQIAAGCGQAYLSAFGSLLGGDNVADQIAVVREQLQAISADCKTALSGA